MSATNETSEEWANDLNELDFGGVTADLGHMQKEDLGIVVEDADAEDEPEAPNKKRKATQELEDRLIQVPQRRARGNAGSPTS